MHKCNFFTSCNRVASLKRYNVYLPSKLDADKMDLSAQKCDWQWCQINQNPEQVFLQQDLYQGNRETKWSVLLSVQSTALVCFGYCHCSRVFYWCGGDLMVFYHQFNPEYWQSCYRWHNFKTATICDLHLTVHLLFCTNKQNSTVFMMNGSQIQWKVALELKETFQRRLLPTNFKFFFINFKYLIDTFYHLSDWERNCANLVIIQKYIFFSK